MPEFKKELFKRLLIALGIVVLLLGFILFLSQGIKKRAETIVNQQQELSFFSEAIALVASLEKEAKKAEPYFSVLENILPSKDRLIDFRRELEGLTKKEDLSFGFSFGEEKAATENLPASVSFTFNTKGPFRKVLVFLESLEKTRFLIKFRKFEFTKDIATDKVNLSLEGSVFFQK